MTIHTCSARATNRLSHSSWAQLCEHDSSTWTPSTLAARVKHWGRTAVAFGLCKAEDEAEACFTEATSLLRLATARDEPHLLEAEILIKGWQVAMSPGVSTIAASTQACSCLIKQTPTRCAQAWVPHFLSVKPNVVLQRLTEAHVLVQESRSAGDVSTPQLDGPNHAFKVNHTLWRLIAILSQIHLSLNIHTFGIRAPSIPWKLLTAPLLLEPLPSSLYCNPV